MNKHPIPKCVLKAAEYILSREGGFVEYLGKRGIYDVYYCAIKNAYTGFPTVYFVHNDDIVGGIEGFDALNISNSFFKD